MSFSDDVILPKSNNLSSIPAVNTKISGSFSDNVILPKNPAEANKIASLQSEANKSAQVSKEANSTSNIIKNTITGLPKAALNTAKSLISPIISPDEHQQSLESTMFPKTGNKIYDTITAPAREIGKVVSRVTNPGIEGTSTSVGHALKVNQLVNIANKSGKQEDAQKVVDYVNSNPDFFHKTSLQDVGDLANLGLTFAAPEAGGSLIEKSALMGVKKSLASGLIKGGSQGLAFGVSQVLSSGEKDPKKIAEMLLQTASGGAILGAITSGAIPVSKEIFNKAKSVEPIYNKLKTEHSTHLEANGPDVTYQKLKDEGMPHAKASDIVNSISEEKVQKARENPEKVIKESIKNIPKEENKIDINKLTSYEGAPDNAQVEKYKKEIQEGKPIEPIVVMKDTDGKLGIEDGKHRYEAYKQLGYTEVPYVVKENKSINVEKPIKEEEMKVTKVAKDINENLVKEGIKSLPPEEQSKYKSGSYKKDLEGTIELMNTDFEKAKNVAIGKENVPENIRYPQVLFNAIAEHARNTGDIELIRKLAKSPLGTERSEAAGTLGSSGFNNDPASPVKQIQKIQKMREKIAEKKIGKNIEKAKSEIINNLKKESRKTYLKREDWQSFVSSIQC